MKKLDKRYFDDVRGVVYIPTKAHNAYQMWRDYSEEVTERDLGYAKSLNLNSLRIWISFEYWNENQEHFVVSFENFLDKAAEKGFRVMPSLFESCGREPIKELMEDTDPITSTAVRSPGTEIQLDPDLWHKPKVYVDWFMEHYRDDERLLAIEAINEPRVDMPGDFRFAVEILDWISAKRGAVPISIGAAALVHNIPFMSHGVDIIQTHSNFVIDVEKFKQELELLQIFQNQNGIPCWVSEWQRIRKSSLGWRKGDTVDVEETMPDHSSLAGILRESGVGTFLWNLMLRPAYLSGQRSQGTFNGIFHEDGSVYSLEDARAVSGNPEFQTIENNSVPEMYKPVRALRGR